MKSSKPKAESLKLKQDLLFVYMINKKQSQSDADGIKKDIEDGGMTGRNERLVNFIGNANY